MPFGLCNAPATFQALMEEIIGEFDFAGGLLDNIAIWADTLEQLHEKMKIILDRLCKYGMKLNIKKFVIYVRESVFLGFVISIKGISADTDKIAAIREHSELSTIIKMRAFVNAIGYFRYLIHKYADKFVSFTFYTGGPKGQKIKLSSEAKKAWQQIRDLITTLLILKLFDWMLPIIIESDASIKAAGAVLLQPHLHGDQSVLHPVAYFSKKWDPTQGRYGTQERELLALVLALRHWRH
jgi:hypothetical protein